MLLLLLFVSLRKNHNCDLKVYNSRKIDLFSSSFLKIQHIYFTADVMVIEIFGQQLARSSPSLAFPTDGQVKTIMESK